jgi:hypothetical protein
MYSFRFDGPFVPAAIVRRQCLACRFIGRVRLARSLLFEAVEQAIDIHPVEDHARALAHSHQLRTPDFIKGAAFDTDILHGLLECQAALEGIHDVGSSLLPALSAQYMQIPF